MGEECKQSFGREETAFYFMEIAVKFLDEDILVFPWENLKN